MIISRAYARALGLRFYFTGVPCLHGHISPRYVTSHGCVACFRTRYRYRDNAPRVAVIKKCLCGTVFTDESRNRPRKYCSSKCRERWSARLHKERHPDRIKMRSDRRAAIKLSYKTCTDCGVSLPIPRVRFCDQCRKIHTRLTKKKEKKDHARHRLLCAESYNRYQAKRHAHFRIMRALGLLKTGDNKWLVFRAARELGIF